MKKVLFTSVALLSLVAGAKVLADGPAADGKPSDQAYVNTNVPVSSVEDDTNGGVFYNVDVKGKVNDVTADVNAATDLSPKFKDGDTAPLPQGLRAIQSTSGLTPEQEAFNQAEAARQRGEKPAAKPAAPTMDQKADKAEKAAAKMGGEKAAAKTLPNTAAVK